MSPLQEAAPEACSSSNRLRTALLVNLAAVLERCDEQMVPAVYRFIGAAFDATPTQLGYITLSRALVQALSAPLGGIAGHCLHRGRVIGCGCLLWSACTAAFAGCHSLGAGAAIWGLNGLGLALVLPNAQSLTADLFVAGQRGRAFGCLYLTAALGGLLGAVWATNIGSHRPLGMEGWRFAFLSLACVSAATGVANLLLATDPLRDQPPLSAAHAISKSGRVSAAELELLQPGSVTGAATGQQLATPWQHGESEAEALSRRQPHDSASSSCARQQPALAGSFPAFQGSQSKQRWCAAMGPAARQIAADIGSVLRIPTFGIIVAQGIMGSIPWSALVFLTLYFQLLGMSDAQASSLVAIFLAGTAFGGLIGGCVGDAAAKLYPHHGRIAVTQFSVGIGIPFACLVFKGLPRSGSDADVFVYAAVLLVFALLKAWPAPACNNPMFAEIVPPHQRNLVYAFDRCFEGAIAACAAPFVGLLAERLFGFSGSGTVTHDRERDLANAAALGNALLAFLVVPWTLTLLLYSGLHLTYKTDKAAALRQQRHVLRERAQSLEEAGVLIDHLSSSGDGSALSDASIEIQQRQQRSSSSSR
ncbi:hypothetical protein D9Q98_002418 [Chlorella vulgaris]|uniref:Major facilitator superfamily (MFS) profile domain-containing protein n=1 Tax=Chlorella vulgaris TaxID=3077 RepID=A0A9D4Z0N8_CHLVU|nr:hypothetical protein D9Q98_002418 [Chlorella vulgaris]